MAEVGDTIAQRYELLERLGSGGMAEVFRARDARLARQVAVKILFAHRAGDPTLRRYFRREARAAATLNHPNAVAVYDTGERGDVQYIVMELVDGPTLQEVISEDGPLPVDRAVDIATSVAEALGAAHAAGIVHRDIKPSNIMFDGDGTVKVADFGLARAVAATTRTAEVYGSASYMAPEQARGDHVDARTDMYALGCVLHEMLAADPPFTGDTAIQVVSQHLHADPPRLSDVRDDLPAGLGAVVLRALAKDPADRFADAEAFVAALRGARDGRPAAAALTATRRLDDAAETVAVAAVAATPAADGDGGEVPDAPAAGSEGPDGPRPWVRRAAALGVLAAVALLALLAVTSMDRDGPLLADDPTDQQPADEPADAAEADGEQDEPPADEGPQDEEPEPPEEEPAADGGDLAGVYAAADEVLDLLEEGVERDRVSEDARDDIRSYVHGAVEEAEDDDWDDALDDVRTAREKVREHGDDGDISRDYEQHLDRVLRDLERAIRDARPRGRD